VTTAYVHGAITLPAIYAKDVADDSWFGMVGISANGEMELAGNLIIGDQAGALHAFFLSRAPEKIVFTDQPCDSNLSFVEDTGQTHVQFGNSVGTGNSRIGYGGAGISSDDAYFVSIPAIDFSVAVETLGVFGTQFTKISGGVLFANDATHYLTNCTFAVCARVDTYGVECRNLAFVGYTGTDGALLWRNGITDTQVTNCTFIACARAIEHTAASTGQDYTNLTFYANVYDVHFSAATGDLIIDANGTSNPSSGKVENDSTGTVTINIVFAFIVYGLELSTEVTIVTAGTTTDLHHEESVSVSDGAGKYKSTYNHAGGASVDVLVHHVDYQPDISNIYGLTLPSVNSSAKVAMFDVANYLNP
jgi:hypothetical protein